jgi:2-polyprenyl-3-methyl-5-hydroxy-6-metoxy-1,4-benzoquinol methylase
LFDEVSGEEYSSSITASLNIGCYEALLVRAQDLSVRPIKKILDFGCGPGTIASSKNYQKSEILLGFDFIKKNRETAKKAGLLTIEEDELEKTPPEYFDLIVCCYVLHYESLSEATILTLLERLQLGGIWAANFHKSKGLSWFRNSLPSSFDFEIISETSEFGELMFIRKVSSNDK